MLKIFLFITLIFLLLSSCLNSSQPYIAKDFETLEFNKSNACACFKIYESAENGTTFYLEVICKEIGAKIDKTLYYNFTETCDPNDCDENNYLYSNKNNNRNLESENSGFYYEYIFEIVDSNKKFLKIQYKDFVGKRFTMQYIPFSMGTIFLGLFILFLIILVIIAIIICFICCVYKKLKRKREQQIVNPELNNQVNAPIIREENILNPKSEQYIELRKY